jgi:hypothetical protein
MRPPTTPLTGAPDAIDEERTFTYVRYEITVSPAREIRRDFLPTLLARR